MQQSQERFQAYFLPPFKASPCPLSKEMSTKLSRNSTINTSRKGATVITGDSTISCLGGNKILNRRNIKVDSFRGEKINSRYFDLFPLRLKKLDKIILHIGTHSTTFMDANEMLKCI